VVVGTRMTQTTQKKERKKKTSAKTPEEQSALTPSTPVAESPERKEILDLEFKLTKLRELVNYLRVELAKERKRNESIN